VSAVQPRLDLARLAPAVHGGAPAHDQGVLDFSQSANPLGSSPRVVAAARAARFDRYPEREASTLRAALAARLGLPSERVVVGSGSAELFWLLALAYLHRDDSALVVGPTFAEYARAARLVGARVVEVVSPAEDGFRPDWGAVGVAIGRERPRVVFLCNPNNPTGIYCGRPEVEALLASTPGLLVLDEAFVGFVGEPWDVRSLLGGERLVVVRSLTKDHALAGLRLGYALAAPEVARALQWVQPPWSVNAAAQAAGLAALAEDAHVARGCALAEQAKALLATELGALGWSVLPSAANFLLAEVGDAAAWTGALRARGIYVRDCTSFGLPHHVRLAARPLAECAALVAAVRAVRHTATAPVSVGP
jgi:histidinol-phosphate aminotransferase